MGSFDEIQQRANKLTADLRFGDPTELRSSQFSGSNVYSTPAFIETSLDDIFKRSEEIWNKKQTLKPIVGMNATLRTIKDQNQLNSTRLNIQQGKELAAEKKQQIVYDDLGSDQTQSDEVDKLVQRAFERARIATERSFLNQQVLERTTGGTSSTSDLFSPRRGKQIGKENTLEGKSVFTKKVKSIGNLPSAPLAHEQELFAKELDKALYQDSNSQLRPIINKAIEKLNSRETNYIWSKVFAILPESRMSRANQNVRELRSEKRWLDSLINSGSKYLQDEFKSYMENTVEGNLSTASRGGVPGTLSLIEAFLKVKRLPTNFKFEDGRHGSHPKWAVLFYCLRIGDISGASKVADGLANNAQCSALVGVLSNLPGLTSIDEERRIKIRAEWKQNSQTCSDDYKSAIYGLFLGFDCPTVNTTIEDWLWARLISCKWAQESTRAFRQLQTTICAQHGERYFVVEGGSHLLYFAVLLLTGQIERAIFILHKSAEYSVHAVHIGLLAQQIGVLLCTDTVSSADILVQDVHEPSICQLNLARLVLLYVKEFELTNTAYALNYCFFLRDFQLENLIDGNVSTTGRSVFDACVSRLVFLNKDERDTILGHFNQQDERMPGLIDKFSGSLNVKDVIGRVAFDISIEGDPLCACQLYALSDRPDDAIQLASTQLSKYISNPSTEQAIQSVKCAEWLARRYGIDSTRASFLYQTLCRLLELYTFFFDAEAGKHREAIELLLQRMKFIPTDPEDVSAAVDQFHMVADEIRPLLPDICSQLMRSIVSAHESALQGSPETLLLKQYAKALILYTAQIPFRFPVSTNSLLLQLRSRIV
uniref:Nuclear pore protein n=2 Tax=Meloidogyne incognita group TaxID=654580 RepID=A0A914LBR6_MELIC